MNLLQRIIGQLTPQKLAYRYRQLRNAFGDTRTLWHIGLPDELAFWHDVFHNPENPHYRHPVTLANPERPFPDYLRDILTAPPGSTIRVLDIGAGPVTQVGYQWPDRTIEIVPIDPLADAYNQLLSDVGCTPPFPTRRLEAERIAEHFEPETFDLIYSRNALDHSYDPMSVLKQARTLLKPGGSMFLRHNRNEGKRVYSGLHQWNVDLQDGALILWNLKRRYVVADELAPVTVTTRLWHNGAQPVIDAQIQKP